MYIPSSNDKTKLTILSLTTWPARKNQKVRRVFLEQEKILETCVPCNVKLQMRAVSRKMQGLCIKLSYIQKMYIKMNKKCTCIWESELKRLTLAKQASFENVFVITWLVTMNCWAIHFLMNETMNWH
jgi:hypothetical protein